MPRIAASVAELVARRRGDAGRASAAGAVVTGALTAEAVLDVVRAAVARVLEIEPAAVTRDSRLRDDLGADSLALVEIAELVEERLPRAPARSRDRRRRPRRVQTVGAAVDLVVAAVTEAA